MNIFTDSGSNCCCNFPLNLSHLYWNLDSCFYFLNIVAKSRQNSIKISSKFDMKMAKVIFANFKNAKKSSFFRGKNALFRDSFFASFRDENLKFSMQKRKRRSKITTPCIQTHSGEPLNGSFWTAKKLAFFRKKTQLFATRFLQVFTNRKCDFRCKIDEHDA